MKYINTLQGITHVSRFFRAGYYSLIQGLVEVKISRWYSKWITRMNGHIMDSTHRRYKTYERVEFPIINLEYVNVKNVPHVH